MEAWRQGLKGVTIWRDGCQRQGILTTDKKSEETPKSDNEPTKIRKASDDCIGRKRTLVTGCGTLHLTAFFDRNTGQLLETYFSKGSQGGCALFMVGLSRMVSLAARGNIAIEDIVDQLKSAEPVRRMLFVKQQSKDTSKGSSCPVAIGYALMDMYNELQHELKHNNTMQAANEIEGLKSKIFNDAVIEARNALNAENLYKWSKVV